MVPPNPQQRQMCARVPADGACKEAGAFFAHDGPVSNDMKAFVAQTKGGRAAFTRNEPLRFFARKRPTLKAPPYLHLSCIPSRDAATAAALLFAAVSPEPSFLWDSAEQSSLTRHRRALNDGISGPGRLNASSDALSSVKAEKAPPRRVCGESQTLVGICSSALSKTAHTIEPYAFDGSQGHPTSTMQWGVSCSSIRTYQPQNSGTSY